MRAALCVLALAGCDHVFGLGDPYEDAARGSDSSHDGAVDVLSNDDGTRPMPALLLAHFSFDTGINDDTGTYIGVDFGNIATPPGHAGNALSLDGSSCVEVTIPATPATYSIAFWAAPAGTATGALFSRRPESNATTHTVQVYQSAAGGGFGFTMLTGTGEVNNIVISGFAQDAWHHYAVTYDGMTKNQYVDGVLKGTQPAGAVVYGSETREYIGCDQALSGYFTGMIDELYLYDGALTQPEVAHLATM